MSLLILNYFSIIIIHRMLHIKKSHISLIFRYILFYIPFAFPLLYINKSNLVYNLSLNYINRFLSLFFCVIIVLYNILSNKIIFQKKFIDIFPKIGKKNLCIKLYESMGSAFLEEIFYRYFFLGVLINKLNGFISICIIAIFFVLAHLFNVNYMKKFTWKKLFILIFFSFSITYLYFSYNNIYFNVAMHLLFNFPYSMFYILITDWEK